MLCKPKAILSHSLRDIQFLQEWEVRVTKPPLIVALIYIKTSRSPKHHEKESGMCPFNEIVYHVSSRRCQSISLEAESRCLFLTCPPCHPLSRECSMCVVTKPLSVLGKWPRTNFRHLHYSLCGEICPDWHRNSRGSSSDTRSTLFQS